MARIEDKINEFYRVSWAVVEDLNFIDIKDDDPIKAKKDAFVAAIRRSFDALTTEGYEAAQEAIKEASIGIIGLCKYKNEHLPHVDPGISRECALAYRALFDTSDVTDLDATQLNTSYVERMEQAHAAQSRFRDMR